MKILITGGGGFLGINLIRYLLRRKGRTDQDSKNRGRFVIVSLDISEFDYPERHMISPIRGDIRDRERVREAMQGVDIVVHTAAALPLYTKEQIESTDIEGTRLLLEEAFREGVQRFIHISSTAVYGIPDHHPLHEDDRLEGVGPYGRAKILAERVCAEYRQRGMCIPILRPKSFIGPERLGAFALLYDWADDGRDFPMIGSGANRYQFLDVEDLCDSIYLCMTVERETANDTYNIGAKDFTTMREDYQAVLDAAGYGKKVIGFPAWPAILLLRFLELLSLSPLYKWVYETAAKDSFVSIEKAESKLGFSPRYSNRDALLRNYRWYCVNREKIKNSSGISHRVPWKQGVLKWIKAFF